MTHIDPHPLWLGHEGDGRDFRQIFDAGIRAVVQLALEVLPTPPSREPIYCHFPLYDGPGNDPDLLVLAVNTVASLLRGNVPTLVCCSMGMRRTPAVAAAALAKAAGRPAEECLEQIARRHPTDVSPAFWNELHKALAARQ